jgi:hypothetical protein
VLDFFNFSNVKEQHGKLVILKSVKKERLQRKLHEPSKNTVSETKGFRITILNLADLHPLSAEMKRKMRTIPTNTKSSKPQLQR